LARSPIHDLVTRARRAVFPDRPVDTSAAGPYGQNVHENRAAGAWHAASRVPPACWRDDTRRDLADVVKRPTLEFYFRALARQSLPRWRSGYRAP
jgi:hypothetical protein